MFTLTNLIDTVETAKLNTIEKVVQNKSVADNLREAVRAEAHFAKAVVATSTNIGKEIAAYDWMGALKQFSLTK